MNNIQKQKGITLIALVITIIVLIILAGVAINLTLGENGILRRAEDAEKLSNEATVKEKIETAVLQVQVEEVVETGRLTLQKLYKNLESKDSNITLNEYVEGDTQLTGTYLFNGKEYSFIIDSNFIVTLGEIEEAEPQPISFGEITWTSGKASITITTELTGTIEYQINGTADGSWTSGDTVSNLNNGDIVYARINDGVAVSEVQQKEIKDTILPESFEITVAEDSITYEAITVSTTGTTDNQTGLKDYSFVVTKAGIVVQEVTGQTVTEYPVKGLSAETEYIVYMLAYDNAGNVRKSNEVTVTTEKMPVGKLFGQPVNYSVDLNDDGDTTNDWRIFYIEDDEENPNYGATYIIASNLLPIAKIPTETGITKASAALATYWKSVPSNSGATTINNYADVGKFIPNYTDTTNKPWVVLNNTSQNDNIKYVATMLNTAYWSNFAEGTSGNNYKVTGSLAIGGPTAEMWVASWNKAYPTYKLKLNVHSTGYQIAKEDEDFTDTSYQLIITDSMAYENLPNVYLINHLTNSTDAGGYRLSSPGTGYGMTNTTYMMVITKSKIQSWGGSNSNNGAPGIRPLIYIPPEHKLQLNESGIFDIVEK